MTISRKTRNRVYCLALCLGLALGCNSLTLNAPIPEKQEKQGKIDKSPKEPLPAAPGKHSFRVSQFVFLADFEMKQDLPLFRELSDMREQVFKELRLPVSNTVVQVYVFEDRDRYERYMFSRYPELPKRRAFFVAQPHNVGGGEDLIVYTYWGDKIREDLRHELTHALLHSVLKDVPLWLDEGLAEYYEVPASWKGVNFHHLDQMQRNPNGPFKPDLARLEKLSLVQQMAPAEYREAWAWVHLMLRGKVEAKAVLINYLQLLRTNPTPGPMQPRLAEVFSKPEDALRKHVVKLDDSPRPQPTAQR